MVLTSSLLLSRLGRPLWRRLHYLVYPAAVLLFLHSLLTDPELKDGLPDLLDGGKIYIYLCLLVIAALAGVRIGRRGRGFRSEKTGPEASSSS